MNNLTFARVSFASVITLCCNLPAMACDLDMNLGPFRFSAGAGAHGGDRLQSDFLQGKRQATHVVETVRTATLYRATEDEAVREWILKNKNELIATLEAARIEFNDNVAQTFCAMVHDSNPTQIQVSRSRCQAITSTAKAGELLIHEAVHLMGIASETFAPAVADAVYRAWEFAGHTLDTNLHSTSASDGLSGRVNHTGVWTGNKVILWGGLTRNGDTGTGAQYDHVLDSWTDVTVNNAPAPRFKHTAIWTGKEMIVWGGARTSRLRSDRVGDHYSTGGRYDPVHDSWQPTPQTNAPSPRYRHTAVWTGQEMVVWGGARQTGTLSPSPSYQYLQSGHAFDPQSNQWRNLATQGAPTPRFDHTAVWADGNTKRMIVWGGYALNASGQAGMSQLGAMWDAASNSWQQMSAKNAPSPRVRHAAVWTGAKLIIWGGYGLENGLYKHLNSGGIYDPTTDTWESINPVNAPVGRDGHVGVWTGSHLLVFGGRNPVAIEPEERIGSTDDYTTVALYNPTTREWRTPLYGDVWMDRRFATGIWTGHQLLTWGGENFRRSGRVFTPR